VFPIGIVGIDLQRGTHTKMLDVSPCKFRSRLKRERKDSYSQGCSSRRSAMPRSAFTFSNICCMLRLLLN
jgi:hypothetical protein